MQKLIALLFAMLVFSAQAQLWERAYQPSEEVHWDRVLPVGGGRWAVIGGTSFAGSHAIRTYSGDGTLAWEQTGAYANGPGAGEVVLLPDSGLLHVGVFDGCDYYGPDSRISRYAPDGTLIWERFITPLMSSPPTLAAKGSTGQIAVAAADSVYILDLDGNTVGGFETPPWSLRKIHWASDSTLFMVLGTELKLADLQGIELASAPIGTNVRDMHWDGQQLFVLANDSVYRFNPDLTPLGNDPMTDLDWSSRFVVSDSALYLNTTTGLYQLAGDGTSSLALPWPALPNLSTTGCAVRNGRVLAVGNTNISGRSTGIVRTLSMDGAAAQHDQDVEVLLHVDSTWTEFVGGFYPWDRLADITGLVVNQGSDTLRSVVLSMWLQVPWILCDMFTNRIDTAGFALAPGDTLVLPFGVVGVRLGLQAAQAEGAGEICIVALAPDHLADRAPDDNTACVSVDFVLGVEGPLGSSSLSLAPNPAINTCMLSGLNALGEPVRLRIMDLTGRIVAERFNSTSTNTMQLDFSGLPPATYILRAEGARSSAVMKLVIARP